jgi:uncharacterized DUF497 family protein
VALGRNWLNPLKKWDVDHQCHWWAVEWDETKNQANQRKHGVSFEEAAQVFLDPLHLSDHDRTEGGERRWQTFGLVAGFVLR